jgi:hypothetical protein
MSGKRRWLADRKEPKRAILWALLLWLAAGLTACTLKLEDKNAPSLEFSLEDDYDVARWGGGEEKSGWAATPPERKQGEGDSAGTAFRIRGQFSNTFTWYDAEGTISVAAFSLGNRDFPGQSVPVKADGWRYRGRLALMPGFAFGGDRFFIAGLIGLEGDYTGMDLSIVGDPLQSEWTEFGRLGVPVGCHIEGTLAHAVTPYFTYAYVPTISSWGLASGGHSQTTKLAVRLWPGSLASFFGSLLWVEGGWQRTENKGAAAPFFDYEINLNGPFGAIGLRF